MSGVFNWAYIGAGHIAKKTADAITKTGRHRILSVYGKTYARAEAFAGEHGAAACRSVEEAISADGVDAVYVATTNDNHCASAKICLEHGRPVLLEKPFTVNKAEAEELVRIARGKKVYLAEAMWTWFSPVARAVRDWVKSGEIGEVTHVGISCVKCIPRSNARIFDAGSGGGALLDMGVYPLTYLYNLLGYPESIKCAGTLEHGVDVEENVTFTYPGGFSVTAEISIIRDPGHEELIITGANGRIECPHYHTADKAYLVKTDTKVTAEGNGYYDNQFDIVAGEIRSGKTESEYVPLDATLDVMEIMDICRRQMGVRYPSDK